jgi:hypothetical protein
MQPTRQADLHSALFYYTPLVISGDWKKYEAHIIMLMQTNIKGNKYTFCIMKSSEPPPPTPKKNIKKPCRVLY